MIKIINPDSTVCSVHKCIKIYISPSLCTCVSKMKEFKLDRYKYNTKSTKRLEVDATKWHSKIKLQDIHFVDSPQNRWKTTRSHKNSKLFDIELEKWFNKMIEKFICIKIALFYSIFSLFMFLWKKKYFASADRAKA